MESIQTCSIKIYSSKYSLSLFIKIPIHHYIQYNYSSKYRFIKIFNIQYFSKNRFIKIFNIIRNPKSLLAILILWVLISPSIIMIFQVCIFVHSVYLEKKKKILKSLKTYFFRQVRHRYDVIQHLKQDNDDVHIIVHLSGNTFNQIWVQIEIEIVIQNSQMC